MTQIRASFKGKLRGAKRFFKNASEEKQHSAPATEDASITASHIPDSESGKEPAASSAGTATAGDNSHDPSTAVTVSNSASHEQPTPVQSANPAATAEASVQSRIDTETIDSDNVNDRNADADTAAERLPVGHTTQHLDSGAALSSSSSEGPNTISRQAAPNYVTAPVADQATASNAPPSDHAAPAKLPHRPPSSHAPIWHKALKTLQTSDPKRYNVLGKVDESASIPNNEKDRILSELSEKEGKPESKALLLRVKEILPSISTTRAAMMPIANLDPHHVAPSVVAVTLFIIEGFIGRWTPEDRVKIRSMLFETVNAINEWISFETNFFKGRYAVEKDVQRLEKQLLGLYSRALQLLCDLLTTIKAPRLVIVGKKLSAEMVKWQEKVNVLKDERASWIAERKVMDEILSRLEKVTEVLNWLKSADDHENSPRWLRNRVTSQGRHIDSASWILKDQSFEAWSKDFFPVKPSVSTTSDLKPKPVLWVSGSYGVGKTTIVHRILTELQRLADGYLPSGHTQETALEAKGLLVIPYFCDTTKRAKYETIVRSIARKLSLLPDFTIAQEALEFYDTNSKGLTHTIDITEYEDLVRSLLKERSKSCNIALLIDALNEIDARNEYDPPQNVERLCYFLSEIVCMNPRVRVLFSSHEQLSGSEKFKENLEKVEVVKSAPKDELKDFINKEIKFRKIKLEDSNSIFLEPTEKELLEELKKSLIDGAKGMYVWVRVWLDITLPLEGKNETVERKQTARNYLNIMQSSSTGASKAHGQLRAGYQRLWDLGASDEFKKIRKRLFRLILCAFKPLELSVATDILRIGVEDDEPLYQQEILAKRIRKLCSNFLFEDDSGHLSWTHDSARDFVVKEILNLADSAEENSMKSNHLLVANIFIAVLKNSNHPVWKELHLDPSEWKQDFFEYSDRKLLAKRMQDAQSSLVYLSKYGYNHCQHAADTHEIFDPLWTKILREIVLQHKTAFAFLWETCLGRSGELILGNHAGKRIILIPHVLASLHLTAYSVPDVQLQKAANAPRERSSRENLEESLVEHVACRNLRGENIFHVACRENNKSILNLMLQIILHRQGGIACVLELLGEEYQIGTPFIQAVSRRYFGIMDTLLRLENRYSESNNCDQSSIWPSSSCLWAAKSSWNKYPFDLRTALTQVSSYDKQDDVIKLLDIHKPCNIDVPNYLPLEETELHRAAKYGDLRLVKLLVEICQATVDVSDKRGKTPLDLARDQLDFLDVVKDSQSLSDKAKETKRELTKNGWTVNSFYPIFQTLDITLDGQRSRLASVIEYLESINHAKSQNSPTEQEEKISEDKLL